MHAFPPVRWRIYAFSLCDELAEAIIKKVKPPKEGLTSYKKHPLPHLYRGQRLLVLAYALL